MNKTIAFGFSFEVETTIKLEKVKETDYGAQRYLKQLVNAFDQEPDALRIIVLTNFIDFYCGDYREELEALLGNLENEQSAILRVAQKCSPEASRYFSDLFAGSTANLSTAEMDEELDPNDESAERALAKKQESEWVFGELMRRLCTFSPVKATFRELPPGNSIPPLEKPEPLEPLEQLEQLELQG